MRRREHGNLLGATTITGVVRHFVLRGGSENSAGTPLSVRAESFLWFAATMDTNDRPAKENEPLFCDATVCFGVRVING